MVEGENSRETRSKEEIIDNIIKLQNHLSGMFENILHKLMKFE